MIDESRRELWFKCTECGTPINITLNFGSYEVKGIYYVTHRGEIIISCRPFGVDYVEFWPRPFIKHFDSYRENGRRVYTIYNEKIAICDFKQVTLVGYGTSYEKMKMTIVSKNNGKLVGEFIKRLPFIEELEEMFKDVTKRLYVLTKISHNKILQILENSYLEIQSPAPIGIVTPEDKRPFEFLPNDSETLEGLDFLLKMFEIQKDPVSVLIKKNS